MLDNSIFNVYQYLGDVHCIIYRNGNSTVSTQFIIFFINPNLC